jgi:hypothetical protein
MAIERPYGLIMRGIEPAIWWSRISSGLGYELASSTVLDVKADGRVPIPLCSWLKFTGLAADRRARKAADAMKVF